MNLIYGVCVVAFIIMAILLVLGSYSCDNPHRCGHQPKIDKLGDPPYTPNKNKSIK